MLYIRLVHFSVKDYLVSDRIRAPKTARYSIQEIQLHQYIVAACLAFLLQLDQESHCDPCRYDDDEDNENNDASSESNDIEDYSNDDRDNKDERDERDDRVDRVNSDDSDDGIDSDDIDDSDDGNNNLLLRYAARRWTGHARRIGSQLEAVEHLSVDFLHPSHRSYEAWVQHDYHMRQNYMRSPLFMMASEGVVALVQILLDMSMNANENYAGQSAPLVASRNGDEAVVKPLREYVAVPNSTHESHNCTSLQAASLCGSLQVVDLLIDAGANVNTELGEYGTALQAAARKGHLKVTKHLIDVKANVHSREEHLDSALMLAM